MTIIFDPDSTLNDFTADGVRGWASVETEETVEQYGGYRERRKCKKVEVNWIGERAYRQVTVRGTTSLRRAIKAAFAHALPTPQARMVGGQELFGEFIEISL